MGKMKYLICDCCGKELPTAARDNTYVASIIPLIITRLVPKIKTFNKLGERGTIANALKYYITGKYNPGDKRHALMVEEDARILMSDPKIKQWMKLKGIQK